MGIFSKIKSGLQKTRDSMVKQVEGMLGSFKKIDGSFLRSWKKF